MFLAISSGLLLIAMTGVNQRQGNAEFTAEMREIESRIKTVFSDVKSGYFDNITGFKCTSNSAGVTIAPSAIPTDRLGENSQCVFLGKAIAFGDSVDPADRGAFRVYTIVGVRPGSVAGIDTDAGISNVFPVAVPSSVPGLTQEARLKSGIIVSNRTNSTYTNIIGAVNGLADTNQEPRTWVFPSTSGPKWGDTMQRAILDDSSKYVALASPLTATYICFEEVDSDRTAQITIGNNGQQLTTELEYKVCDV